MIMTMVAYQISAIWLHYQLPWKPSLIVIKWHKIYEKGNESFTSNNCCSVAYSLCIYNLDESSKSKSDQSI